MPMLKLFQHYACTLPSARGEDELTTKELFLTVHLTSSPARDPTTSLHDGAHAATCTRCLRVPHGARTAVVNETFLLELPDVVMRNLSADLTEEVTSRRLHVVNQQERKLTEGVHVAVLLHDQTVADAAAGALVGGSWPASPEWLRANALRSVAADPGKAAGGDDARTAERTAIVLKATSASGEAGRRSNVAGGRIGLRAQLQRVGAWVDDTPTAHELRTSRSQRGFRSLRLVGPSGMWLPVVRDGMQHPATGTGALAGSILGLDIGSGVALEESFARGVRQETIRSTVQVVNDLDFAVQVRLI